MSASAARDAHERARRIYPRSKGFQGAYRAGALAARNGKSPDVCPYGRDPRKTWGSSWRIAWMRGHQSERGTSDLDGSRG